MDRLEKAAHGGGYIFGTAEDIPSDMPRDNLKYYLKVSKKLRKYPR